MTIESLVLKDKNSQKNKPAPLKDRSAGFIMSSTDFRT
jgi:hypothetical protein